MTQKNEHHLTSHKTLCGRGHTDCTSTRAYAHICKRSPASLSEPSFLSIASVSAVSLADGTGTWYSFDGRVLYARTPNRRGVVEYPTNTSPFPSTRDKENGRRNHCILYTVQEYDKLEMCITRYMPEREAYNEGPRVKVVPSIQRTRRESHPKKNKKASKGRKKKKKLHRTVWEQDIFAKDALYASARRIKVDLAQAGIYVNCLRPWRLCKRRPKRAYITFIVQTCPKRLNQLDLRYSKSIALF